MGFMEEDVRELLLLGWELFWMADEDVEHFMGWSLWFDSIILASIFEHSAKPPLVKLWLLLVVLAELLAEFIMIVVQQSELSMIDRSYTDSDILPIKVELSMSSCTTILSSFMYKSLTLLIRV
jgi:hypothetical protein